MSITTEIERLQNAKNSLKNSLENKGVTVDETATLDVYSTYIDEITTGGTIEKMTDCDHLFDANSRLGEMDIVVNLIGKATTMEAIFQNASSLTPTHVEKFKKIDTSQVTDIRNGFYGCGLTSIDLSDIDLSSVTNIVQIFGRTNNLITVKLDNPTLTNATIVSSAFYNMFNAVSINLTGVDFGKVETLTNLFTGSTKIEFLKFANNLGKGYTRTTSNYSAYTLDLSPCTELTYESLMDVINKIYDLNLTYNVANGGKLYTQKLVLGSTNIAKLTSEELSAVTNKGWVVS